MSSRAILRGGIGSRVTFYAIWSNPLRGGVQASLPDVLSDLDVKILLKHLERDMKVVVVQSEVASKLIHNHLILISCLIGHQVD